MKLQTFESNRLIILESLNDEKTGKKLAEELDAYDEVVIPVEYYDIPNKSTFYGVFGKIMKQSGPDNKPIIHLEIHGHQNNMGLVLKSGEFVLWQYLYILCKELNLKTKNNLFLTLATCRGAHLMGQIKPYDRCPWGFILSSFKNLWSDTIFKDFLNFYSILFKDKNVEIAYRNMAKNNPDASYEIIDSYETFNRCENYFLKELENEVNEKIKGKIMLEATLRTSSFEQAREKLNIDYNTKILTEEDMIDYFSKNYIYATRQMVEDFKRFFFFWE